MVDPTPIKQTISSEDFQKIPDLYFLTPSLTCEMETFCNEMNWMVINSMYLIKQLFINALLVLKRPSNLQNNNEEFSISD